MCSRVYGCDEQRLSASKESGFAMEKDAKSGASEKCGLMG
jgi:hypothetical protein